MAAKLLLLLPLLFARATGGSCASAAPAAASPGSWVLTFEDDFDGTALNTSSWTVADRDPTKSQYDGHDAVYLAENIEVANGSLVISTAWAPQMLNGVAYNFSSGWVDTQGKRNQTRGRWEASMRMPAGGNGVGDGPTGAWPAWWLLPGSCWPIGGEVDIIEYYVGEGHYQHSRPDNPPQYSASYHYGYGCGDDLYHYPNDTQWYPSGDFSPNWPIIDYTADFHVFGVEINDTAMRFYSENASNTVFTIAAPTLCVDNPDFVWGKSMYLPFSPLYGILEVAVNAQRTTNVSWWLHNTAKTYVDWVRFWQFEPSEVPIEA